MNTQELIKENEFLRSEVKRCYKELKGYEVFVDEIEKLLNEVREFLEGES